MEKGLAIELLQNWDVIYYLLDPTLVSLNWIIVTSLLVYADDQDIRSANINLIAIEREGQCAPMSAP